LNHDSPGNLRIWTQYGTELGNANNARNMVLQPVGSQADYIITTSMTFPAIAVANSQQLGQTAGIIVYQDDDNFIYLGRYIPPTAGAAPQLQFVQETSGTESVVTYVEANVGPLSSKTIYLQIQKSGTTYSAFFSYDNVHYFPFPQTTAATVTPTNTATGTITPVTPTATSTPVAAAVTASYGKPQVGVFAWGGSNTSVSSNALPADFDWFRVGNTQVPAATALPTSTGTAVTLTATASPTATNTSVVTSSPTATSTSTSTPTSTPTPTNTPIPTPTPKPPPTPKPRRSAPVVAFKWTSIWYHVVHKGTFEHIEAKATRNGTKGIWVHIIFATGLHLDYYQKTDGNGHWVKEFNIPADTISAYSNQAIVTFQLWKGKTTAKTFSTFTVIP
jgi:hypothetical protein